jgi:hypothetical protein
MTRVSDKKQTHAPNTKLPPPPYGNCNNLNRLQNMVMNPKRGSDTKTRVVLTYHQFQ